MGLILWSPSEFDDLVFFLFIFILHLLEQIAVGAEVGGKVVDFFILFVETESLVAFGVGELGSGLDEELFGGLTVGGDFDGQGTDR